MKSIISHAANDIIRSTSDMHEIKEVKMVSNICKNLDDKKIPWATITAYKSCPGDERQTQLRKNKADNIALFSRLRDVLGYGVETINKFIGKWPTINDSSSTPEHKESFLVCKPKNMTQEEFESLMVSLGSKYHQDCVVVSSNGKSRCLPCGQKSCEGAGESWPESST